MPNLPHHLNPLDPENFEITFQANQAQLAKDPMIKTMKSFYDSLDPLGKSTVVFALSQAGLHITNYALGLDSILKTNRDDLEKYQYLRGAQIASIQHSAYIHQIVRILTNKTSPIMKDSNQ